MHNNWLRLDTQSRNKHISLRIADYSLSSLTCCHRFALRMWDKTTYPFTLLVQIPTGCTEGKKQVIILIVKNCTISIPKISWFQESLLLTNWLVTLQLLFGCGDIWESLRLNTHRRPAWPPLSFLTSASLSQRALQKKRHVCQTVTAVILYRQSGHLPPYYTFINAKIIYLIVIILTPSSAKPVCKEKKSW